MRKLMTASDPFGDLMPRHIYKVVLICSEYDQFLIEEDGRVEEELFREYTQLGLSNPPKITYARNIDDVFMLLATNKFDLVVTMLELGNTSVIELAQAIKNQYPSIPIVALSPSPSHRINEHLKKHHIAEVDYLYYWQGNANIFLAMVKLLEDKMNALHDAQSAAEVPVIILVENSVRFYSSYLPILYTAIIQQTRMSMSEGLNTWATALRMRGRPKILLAQDYEEALELYHTYQKHLLGIITDISFEREGIVDSEAGLRFCRYIRQQHPDLPILLQSTKDGYAETALHEKSSFIWKLSPSLLTDLRQYVFDNYGFGPFVFRDAVTGEEIARSENLREMQHTLPSVPVETFVWHSNRNDFSRWLKARSLYVLANLFRPYSVKDFTSPEELRTQMVEMIKEFRINRGKGVIAQFNRNSFDELSFFSRIGSGSLGGKGRGLAFIDFKLRQSDIIDKYPAMYLSIPRTIVIATDIFAQYMEENELYDVVANSLPDETLRRIFLSKPLPKELMLDLRTIIKILKVPLAVRSSSMLEDSHYQPFAGVYETCMLPNAGSDEERLKELASAIICVYASTYYNKSKEYLRATNHMVEEERMAVIIQQVIGSAHGDYWYPNFAGVARSLNFYPIGTEKAEDGVSMLCFGFGKTVVDNGMAFRFSPTYPKRNLQYLGGMESSSQTSFYGLNITQPYTPEGNPENLVSLPLSEAEAHPESLKHIASTFDSSKGMLVDQLSAQGQKVITFNSILKYNTYPIAAIIKDLLTFGERVMSTPIEIEFACNLNKPKWKKPEFSLLQIRPIVSGLETETLHVGKQELQRAYIVSHHVMGNGHNEHIRDVIFVKPDAFNPAKTAEMVLEIDAINSQFAQEEKEYILVVAGRLGSSDPWLGIPVVWSQISNAAVIIETSLPGFQVEPSQGTHFFQNITSLGTIYFTVNPSHKDGTLSFDRFNELSLIHETKHFKHVQSDKPLIVKADGRSRLGVVTTSE
jgi:CheY-like chemotaxis protein